MVDSASTNAPQSSRYIRIKYRTSDDQSWRSGESVTSIDKDILAHFSGHAGNYIRAGRAKCNFGINTQASESAIMHVMNWMKSQPDVHHPAPLPSPPDFEQGLWVLQICHVLAVSAELAGNEVMKEMTAYIRMAALTRDEFAMPRT